MTARIYYLPVPKRKRTLEEDRRLDAATKWLLTELVETVSIAALCALAEKEISKPRDAIHRIWAETFLKETKDYEKKTS